VLWLFFLYNHRQFSGQILLYTAQIDSLGLKNWRRYPEFPALEHLELRHVYVGLQLDLLFCLLHKCPKLLVLSLESLRHFTSDGMVQPADTNDTTSKYSSVSFPKLHVLQIIKDLPTSLAIIRLLGIPRKALVMRTIPSFLRGGEYICLPCNEKEWREVLCYARS
jgi:hypothetical protein